MIKKILIIFLLFSALLVYGCGQKSNNDPPVVGKTISGKVLYSGAGLANVFINVTKEASGYTTSATTDVNGDYKVSSLSAGIYYLTPFKENRKFTPLTRSADVSLSSKTGINFDSLAILSGKVGFSNIDAGVEGVIVHAYDNLGNPFGIATTDAQGLFEFSGVELGKTYTYTVSKEGWLFTPSSKTVVVSSIKELSQYSVIGTPEGWKVVNLGVSADLNDIKIDDKTEEGIILGNLGTVFITIDGGLSWTNKTSSAGISEDLIYGKVIGTANAIFSMSDAGNYFFSSPEAQKSNFGKAWPTSGGYPIGDYSIPFRAKVVYDLSKTIRDANVVVDESFSTAEVDLCYLIDADQGKLNVNYMFLEDALIYNSGTWETDAYDIIPGSPILLSEYSYYPTGEIISVIAGRDGFLGLSEVATTEPQYKKPLYLDIYTPSNPMVPWNSSCDLSAVYYVKDTDRVIIVGSENGGLYSIKLDSSKQISDSAKYLDYLPVSIKGIYIPSSSSLSNLNNIEITIVGEKGLLMVKE